MRDIIKTILYSWKERPLPEPIAREVNIDEYLKTEPRKIVVITGFRRAGKTYLLFHAIKELLKEKSRDQIIYVSFEDERIPLDKAFLSDLIPAIKEMSREKPEILFLDEIHAMPEWSRWLRRIYDTENFRIVITGSSSKLSNNEIPTELRGRSLEKKVFPLSFLEFLDFKNAGIRLESIKYSENQKAMLLSFFNEFLEYGGLPEIVLSPENKKFEIVQSYYNTVVKKDIVDRFKVSNEEGLKVILRQLTNSTSYTISKMYNTLKSLNQEIGKSTVQTYISYIEASYFMHSLPIFSRTVKNQLQYPRKVYLIDNAFISLLSSRFSNNKGRLFENLAFIELARRHANDPTKELYYWKNQRQEEVDFVIKDDVKVVQLIQVCIDISDFDTKKRELRALIQASNELECADLLVLTEDFDGEESIKGKTIRYIPLWKWLLER